MVFLIELSASNTVVSVEPSSRRVTSALLPSAVSYTRVRVPSEFTTDSSKIESSGRVARVGVFKVTSVLSADFRTIFLFKPGS